MGNCITPIFKNIWKWTKSLGEKNHKKNKSEAGREPRDDSALNDGKKEFQKERGAQ